MKSIRWRGSFRNDYKRIIRRHYRVEKLEAVLNLLRNDESLSIANHPHLLHGEWKGHWECHVAPNWLLIYKVTDKEVILARTGTHADLFE